MKIGFRRGVAFSSLYYHAERDVHRLIHGDDYVSVADKKNLVWLKGELESAFEIKTDMLGRSDPELKSSGKILNRLIHVDSDGWKLEADPRHAELLIEAMGVRDGKGLATPGVDERDDDQPDEMLDGQWAASYRSIVARANYLATGRPDIAFAVKELCRTMSQPTKKSWDKLARVTKILA